MGKIIYGRTGIFSPATFIIKIIPNTSMTVNTDNANIPLGKGYAHGYTVTPTYIPPAVATQHKMKPKMKIPLMFSTLRPIMRSISSRFPPSILFPPLVYPFGKVI